MALNNGTSNLMNMGQGAGMIGAHGYLALYGANLNRASQAAGSGGGYFAQRAAFKNTSRLMNQSAQLQNAGLTHAANVQDWSNQQDHVRGIETMQEGGRQQRNTDRNFLYHASQAEARVAHAQGQAQQGIIGAQSNADLALTGLQGQNRVAELGGLGQNITLQGDADVKKTRAEGSRERALEKTKGHQTRLTATDASLNSMSEAINTGMISRENAQQTHDLEQNARNEAPRQTKELKDAATHHVETTERTTTTRGGVRKTTTKKTKTPVAQSPVATTNPSGGTTNLGGHTTAGVTASNTIPKP